MYCKLGLILEALHAISLKPPQITESNYSKHFPHLQCIRSKTPRLPETWSPVDAVDP